MNVALRPDSLNLISLCTGGGGLDLGIGLALPGAHPVVMVEREAFAVGHLVAAIEQGLMAPAAIWSDVRTFDGRPWRGLVDGLVGGIPCQGHSMAGKKRGSLDERDLWSPARRIIVQSRPWFVVIENVEGMLTPGDDEIAGAERVIRDLRKLRYTVEIGLFSASETGASHQRNRVFIVAVADSGGERRPEVPRSAHGHESPNAGWASAHDHVTYRFCEGVADTRRCGQRRKSDHDDNAGGVSVAGGDPMVDAISGGHDGRADDALRRSIVGDAVEGASLDLSLFPPGPSDIDRWRRVLAHSPDLEPAVRRMADGVAARLDLAGPHAARIERLRMLGNGVVPLEAAYAVRTLCARLAADGSARAAQLVRVMEPGEMISHSPQESGQ